MSLADPMEALLSLQQEVRRGLTTHPAQHVDNVRVVLDQPNGVTRYTYARIEHGRVKSIAILVHHEPIDGIPCFNLGYAVQEHYRTRGLAKEIVTQAISEMRNGLGRHGIKSFYVEAVVGRGNIPSQRVALAVISDQATEGTDFESGEPIFCYKRLVHC